MEDSKPATSPTRREFIGSTSRLAAASALSGIALPHVHAAEDNTIKAAVIGCGGRGAGAAANAMSVSESFGPVRLHAMVDVFEDRLDRSFNALSRRFKDRINVTPERKFLSFDGYRHAMDLLRPGDIAIFTTPLAFRPLHFEYAIKKRLNVFMEKPVTADGHNSRRMLALAEEARKQNLKVGVGLMGRHCRARQELWRRIQEGEIGEILLMRAYRMHGPIGSCATPGNNGSLSDLMYQIRRFHGFLWLSGGAFSDFNIHNIDECCWMKGSWPVKARALGGRHYRGDNVDQNFDHYAVEYTFEDGTKLLFDGRTMVGCHSESASYAHGTKCGAVISNNYHPVHSRIFKDQRINPNPRHRGADVIWAAAQPEPNPYDMEWEDLIDAIRRDQPYNEAKRGVEASVVTSMGRFAAHTGQEITYDEMLNHEHAFAPDLSRLDMDSPSPLPADADGRYPVPEPGIKRNREY